MDESMAVQEHVALARSLFELCNSRQSDPAWLDKMLAAFAADCEIIDAPSGTTFHGPDGYKRFTRFLTESFPEMRTEVTNAFATEDRVVLEGMFRGITRVHGICPPELFQPRGARAKCGCVMSCSSSMGRSPVSTATMI